METPTRNTCPPTLAHIDALLAAVPGLAARQLWEQVIDQTDLKGFLRHHRLLLPATTAATSQRPCQDT
jgi:hypothetical protein